MQTLKVDLGERSYPIYIGEGLLDQPELHWRVDSLLAELVQAPPEAAAHSGPSSAFSSAAQSAP